MKLDKTILRGFGATIGVLLAIVAVNAVVFVGSSSYYGVVSFVEGIFENKKRKAYYRHQQAMEEKRAKERAERDKARAENARIARERNIKLQQEKVDAFLKSLKPMGDGTHGYLRDDGFYDVYRVDWERKQAYLQGYRLSPAGVKVPR